MRGSSQLKYCFVEVPGCIQTGVFSIDKLGCPDDPQIECIVSFDIS